MNKKAVTRRPSLPLLLCGAAVLAAMPWAAQADEWARVVSSTPIVQPVTVQRQVCAPPATPPSPTSTGVGAVIGAIAGGVIGNAIGGGSGRDLATGAGIVGGAIVGNQIESSNRAQAQAAQQCTTQNVVESRVIGYQVTWEYAGKQYITHMAQDPGAWVRVQIIPIEPAALGPSPAAASPVPMPR